MITAVAAFFFETKLGQACVAGFVLAGLVLWFASDQRAKGAAGALVQVEQTNAESVKKADRARARSRKPGAGGVRDPYTVSD